MEVKKEFPTIFGRAKDNMHVVFAIDTSGSMYNKLDSVKTHLIEFLLELANRQNASFNIIEFSSEIRCWADEMVACSQSTVEVALPWIKTLAPKTGTNTLDALLTAFGNDCDSVYLVTDGLPDQHAFDILDEVVYASNQRPVNSIYLTGDMRDAQAVQFLEGLSKETRGTFLMASIVRYGCMEKITPVYKADHAHERLVRTQQGTMHPSSSKYCSVTTSLSGQPILPLYPMMQAWPYLYEPYWWTRFHTAKTFMRSATKLGDSLVQSNMGVAPSAAVMLIGQKVVARRQEDGFYYPGTVNSQLGTEMFLVEFHPTKVGDYQETRYQDTAIHDIISFTDALRHPVIPGDRVLAPTQEGSYCPAVVLQGMEYRGTDSGGMESPMTVSLCDGRTRDLPPNSAIWIPHALYDRVSLELKVPETARKPMNAVEGYPLKTLPGYPRSGTVPVPGDYSRFYPSVVDCGDVLMDCTWFGFPQFVGIHSAMYKPKSQPPVCFKASEIEAKAAVTEPVKVAQPQEKKEVTIAEPEVVEEPEEKEEEKVEVDEKEEEKEEEKEPQISEEEYLKMLEEICDSAEPQQVILRPKRTSKYVPWKSYWKKDQIPEMIEPNRPGPFRDTTLKVPMELRELRLSECGVENSRAQFSPVKSARVPRHNETNLYRMNVLARPQSTPVPHPPPPGPRPPIRPQEAGMDFTKSMGEAQIRMEEQEALQRDFRRRRVILREDERVNKMLEGERMTEMMRDQHRERVLEQMVREQTRERDLKDARNRTLEGKRQLAIERREYEAEKARQEIERSNSAIQARRTVQINRLQAEEQHRQELQKRAQMERAAKDARSQQRWQQRHEQLESDERQRLLLESRQRGVKMGRRERYRLLERQGQEERQLKATVFKDKQAVFQTALSY